MLCYNSLLTSNCPSSYATQDCPPVSLEQFSFLERIFNKTNLEERMWAKLVTLDTLHWYCDGPEPTIAARRYDTQVHQCESITLYLGFLWLYFYTLTVVLLCVEVNVAKRRAYIKQQAANAKITRRENLEGVRFSQPVLQEETTREN